MLVLGIVLFGVAERIAFTRQDRASQVTAEQLETAEKDFATAKHGDYIVSDNHPIRFVVRREQGVWLQLYGAYGGGWRYDVGYFAREHARLVKPSDPEFAATAVKYSTDLDP